MYTSLDYVSASKLHLPNYYARKPQQKDLLMTYAQDISFKIDNQEFREFVVLKKRQYLCHSIEVMNALEEQEGVESQRE